MEIWNVLTRTQLRALGEFLLGNERAARIGFETECTEDTLLALRRDDLETVRANGKDFSRELAELEDANQRVGFYMGPG